MSETFAINFDKPLILNGNSDQARNNSLQEQQILQGQQRLPRPQNQSRPTRTLRSDALVNLGSSGDTFKLEIARQQDVEPNTNEPNTNNESLPSEEILSREAVANGTSLYDSFNDSTPEQDEEAKLSFEKYELARQADAERLRESETEKHTTMSNITLIGSLIEITNRELRLIEAELTKDETNKGEIKTKNPDNGEYIEEKYYEKNEEIFNELKALHKKINLHKDDKLIIKPLDLQNALNDCTDHKNNFDAKTKEFRINSTKIKFVNEMCDMLDYIKNTTNKDKLDQVKTGITNLLAKYAGDEISDEYKIYVISTFEQLKMILSKEYHTEKCKYFDALLNEFVHDSTKENYRPYNEIILFKEEFNKNVSFLDNLVALITTKFGDDEAARVKKIINECKSFNDDFKKYTELIKIDDAKTDINDYIDALYAKDKNIYATYETAADTLKGTLDTRDKDLLLDIKKLTELIDSTSGENIKAKEQELQDLNTKDDEYKKSIKEILEKCKITVTDNATIYDAAQVRFADMVNVGDPKGKPIADLDTGGALKAIHTTLTDATAGAAFNKIGTDLNAIDQTAIDALNTQIDALSARILPNITNKELDDLATELDDLIARVPFLTAIALEEDKVDDAIAACVAVNDILLTAANALIVKATFEEDTKIAQAAIIHMKNCINEVNLILEQLHTIKNEFMLFLKNADFASKLMKNYVKMRERIADEIVRMNKMVKPIRDYKNDSAIDIIKTLTLDLLIPQTKANIKKFLQTLFQIAINDHKLDVKELVRLLGDKLIDDVFIDQIIADAGKTPVTADVTAVKQIIANAKRDGDANANTKNIVDKAAKAARVATTTAAGGTLAAMIAAIITAKNKVYLKAYFENTNKTITDLIGDNVSFNGDELAEYVHKVVFEFKAVNPVDLIKQLDISCSLAGAGPTTYEHLFTNTIATYITAEAAAHGGKVITMEELYTDITIGQTTVTTLYTQLSNAAFLSNFTFQEVDTSADVALITQCVTINTEYKTKVDKLIALQAQQTALIDDLTKTPGPIVNLTAHVKAVHDNITTPANKTIFPEFDNITFNAFRLAVNNKTTVDITTTKTPLIYYLNEIIRKTEQNAPNGISDDPGVVAAVAHDIAFLTKIKTEIDIIKTSLEILANNFNEIKEILDPTAGPGVKQFGEYYDDYNAELGLRKTALDTKLAELTTFVGTLNALDFTARKGIVETLIIPYRGHLNAITSTIPTFECLKNIYVQAIDHLNKSKDKITDYEDITKTTLENYKGYYKKIYDSIKYIEFIQTKITMVNPILQKILADIGDDFTSITPASVVDPIDGFIAAYTNDYDAKKTSIDGVDAAPPGVSVPPEYETDWNALLTGHTQPLARNKLIDALTDSPFTPFIKGGGGGRGIVSNICVFTFNNTVMVLITIVILYIIYHMLFVDTDNALYRLVTAFTGKKLFNRHRQRRTPIYACDMQQNVRYDRQLL